MKIGFIAPAWDIVRDKPGAHVFLLAPLTFPVLAALTPEDIEIDVIEERLRPVPFEADYDLVGLTFVTAFAPHSYSIADKFRERGVPVVLGGPHVTVRPEEALGHADAVVVGEAEKVWGRLIADFRRGKLERVYRAEDLVDMKEFPRPRLDVVPREFTVRNVTLGSKGCPNRCRFCFISAVNRHVQRFRPIPEVVGDIERMENHAGLSRDLLVFWDDNIAGDRQYLKELCRAITPFKKKWLAAAATNVADDDEIPKLLERSGCAGLFIGLESVNSASLEHVQKHHNKVEKFREMMAKLHDHGVGVTGAFIFGLDQDDRTVFDRTLEFVMGIDLDCMTPAIFTPLPGTAVYEEMENEGRIIDRNWAHYDYHHVVFEPRLMSREELEVGFIEMMNAFFSYGSIFKRLSRSRTQLLMATLLNLGYHKFYRRMLHELPELVQGDELAGPPSSTPEG
jgi:radical SAM superfamily enzyme YgiQ (UPF0313 family)